MSTRRGRQFLVALFSVVAVGVGAPASAAPLVVSITIDDGYDDAPQFAALLEARGLRATYFIVSGYLGHPGYLSPAQVRAWRPPATRLAGTP